MMGAQLPPQSTVTDLSTLLALLQLANDPAKVQSILDALTEARVRAETAAADAVAAERKAVAAQLELASAEAIHAETIAKVQAKLQALEIRSGEVQDQVNAYDALMADLRAKQNDFEAKQVEFANLKAEQANYISVRVDALALQSTELDGLGEKLAAAIADADATKKVYEDKLAALKAIV